jgi:hypothetical protein
MADSVPSDEVVRSRHAHSLAALDEVVERVRNHPRHTWVNALHTDQASRWAAGDEILVEDDNQLWCGFGGLRDAFRPAGDGLDCPMASPGD